MNDSVQPLQVALLLPVEEPTQRGRGTAGQAGGVFAVVQVLDQKL